MFVSAMTYAADEGNSRVGHLCRLLEQDRQYLEENLEAVLRGELASEEVMRLAPDPSNKQCEESFAFEVEKAEFLLVGLKAIPEVEIGVARAEILFGTPVVNQMLPESDVPKVDSLILLEMVATLPPIASEKVVEMKSSVDSSNATMRKDLPFLWRDLVTQLRTKIKKLSRSFKLSATSVAP